MTTDVLVAGGGIAGHRAALAARRKGAQVVMAFNARGASPYVVGFNVPLGHADPEDCESVFFDDTVRGGYGLNDRSLVHVLSSRAVSSFNDLVSIGVTFARNDGRYLQRHLSGNTYPRSVYIPEGTGRIVLDKLGAACSAAGVDAWPGFKLIVLLRDGDRVVGGLLYRRNTDTFVAVRASAVVLATGGIGRLFDDSTYPTDVGADSYSLALDAGATLLDMEFVQFEPVVTTYPEGCAGMEMPTAMLGDGAALLNAAGERFMFRYNPEHGEKRIEKARLALCIQREIDEGRGLPDHSVFFDTTAVPPEKLEGYVVHCKRLRAAGLDPLKERPRVRPAAHSQMGGIHIDKNGWSGVPGLYVGGEAAGGVHGASRLAGNGATDVIVFGAVAGEGAAAAAATVPKSYESSHWRRIIDQSTISLREVMHGRGETRPGGIKSVIRRVMGASAGLYRSRENLTKALTELEALQAELHAGVVVSDVKGAIEALEARSMMVTARTIVEAALARTESRGAHQRIDYPAQDDQRWLQHVAIRRDAGALRVQLLPIR